MLEIVGFFFLQKYDLFVLQFILLQKYRSCVKRNVLCSDSCRTLYLRLWNMCKYVIYASLRIEEIWWDHCPKKCDMGILLLLLDI